MAKSKTKSTDISKNADSGLVVDEQSNDQVSIALTDDSETERVISVPTPKARTLSGLSGIDRVYCLNLPERTDRKAKMIERYVAAGIQEPIFWPALRVKAPTSHAGFEFRKFLQFDYYPGCFLGHYHMLKHASKTCTTGALFCEDDLVLCSDFAARWEVLKHYIPSDAGITYLSLLFLGHERVERLSPHVLRVFSCGYGTECYYMTMEQIRHTIARMESLRNTVIDTAIDNLYDRWYQSAGKAYALTPFFGYQDDTHSNISESSPASHIANRSYYAETLSIVNSQ